MDVDVDVEEGVDEDVEGNDAVPGGLIHPSML